MVGDHTSLVTRRSPIAESDRSQSSSQSFFFSNRAMVMVQPAKCARYTLQGTLLVAEMPLSLATHRVGMTRVDSSARLEGGDRSFGLSLSSAAWPLIAREVRTVHHGALCSCSFCLFRAIGVCSLVLPHLCQTEWNQLQVCSSRVLLFLNSSLTLTYCSIN